VLCADKDDPRLSHRYRKLLAHRQTVIRAPALPLQIGRFPVI
jgi:hypothetical protein